MGDERSANPDGHPREGTVSQQDAGFQGRLRSALSLLSSGASGLATSEDGKTALGLQVESPEPRVLRVAYLLSDDDRALGLGDPALVVLDEGVDGCTIRRSYVAPLQGLAIAVPAGRTKIQVKSLAVFAKTNSGTRVSASLTAGYLASRWFCDALNDSLTVAIFPLVSTIAAPQFATHARVTVLTGAIAEPIAGAPLWLAGTQAIVCPNEYGLLPLSAALPNTVVAVEWRITE